MDCFALHLAQKLLQLYQVIITDNFVKLNVIIILSW